MPLSKPPRRVLASPGRANADAELASTRRAIGRKIAALRDERGLSVRALGEVAGVTGGFVSQVENGHVTPSVASLLRIATALGVQVGDFFERPEATGDVRHPGERTVYHLERGVVDEVVSDDPTGEVEVLHTWIEPGGGTGDALYTHGTRVEVVYVLAGTLVLGLGDARLDLGAGDSVTFSGETPHGVWNRGDTPAEAIWVAAPARY